MHVALIGCSSAGKTTLAQAILTACQERGVPAWLSDDFAMRRLHLGWIRNGFVRRRVLELSSFAWFVVTWRRHRAYSGLIRRVIRDAPGGWAYKLTLLRLTVRKLGIHALVESAVEPDQIVVSENEAVLQAAHHLFVHPVGRRAAPLDSTESALLAEFAERSPRPDLIAYVRVPSDVLVDRMLRRGHRRLGTTNRRRVERFVDRAVETFERLQSSLEAESSLFVIDQGANGGAAGGARQNPTWPSAVEPMLSAALESLGRKGGGPEPGNPQAGSKLVGALVTRLNGDVAYCCLENGYSEPRLDVTGKCLSLLIARSDYSRACGIFAELGFRGALSGRGGGSSVSLLHVALDRVSGELICVRAATEALFETGPQRGYRLPVESVLLGEARLQGGISVPSDAAALLLEVLCTIVELGSRGRLKDWPARRESVRRNLHRLAMRCSTREVLTLVDAHCAWIGEALFLECLNALFEGRPLPSLLLLSRRVRRALRTSSGTGWIGGPPRHPFTWLVARQTLPVPRRTGRTLHSGGALIAFVGPDATGKSTLAADAARWLRGCVDVEEVHLGKPRGTLWTYPMNGGLKVLRAIRGRRPRWKPRALRRAGDGHSERVAFASLLYAVRAVGLALERRRALLKAFGASTRGNVVVCDRYPNRDVGAMDGPRLPVCALGSGPFAGSYRMLARLEHRLYEQLPAAHVLIKLSVSLDEAKRRNRERAKSDKHTEEDLQERHRLQDVSWPVSRERIREIDTGGSIDTNVLAVRAAIWTAL